MKEGIPKKEENREELKYLKSGEQTIVTQNIEKIALSITSTSKSFDDKIKAICSFVKSLQTNKENKTDIFRKRTADEIISSKYVTGCTDEALVFITIARAMNIPAKYIETIDLDFLNKNETGNYKGHIYSGVYKGGEGWKIVDQTKRKIDADIEKDGRAFYKEGLDSWDIGIKDLQTLKVEFDKFHESYINKK